MSTVLLCPTQSLFMLIITTRLAVHIPGVQSAARQSHVHKESQRSCGVFAADDEASNGAGLAAGLVVPSMDAVLQWACATLDTHFITLAGLPAGAQPALLSLRERIQESLQVCCSILQQKRCLLYSCDSADPSPGSLQRHHCWRS